MARPLSGGYSGEVFLVEYAGERAVLRVYGSTPERAAVDAGLLRLVHGLVPVPRVLDLRHNDPAQPGPAHLLTSFEPGERLDLVLTDGDAVERSRLASGVVDVLVALSGVAFLRPGMFVDADLTLSDSHAPAAGLVEWLDLHVGGSALGGWDAGLLRSLAQVCQYADVLLDGIDRTCLVHSDFNGKNILVDRRTGAVTAVLDWEFAHAGSPYADLGNLVRFDRGTAWADDVVAGFVDRARGLAPDPLTLAYASDLWALIDLAGRACQHDVGAKAALLLTEIARAQDLHASPPTVTFGDTARCSVRSAIVPKLGRRDRRSSNGGGSAGG